VRAGKSVRGGPDNLFVGVAQRQDAPGPLRPASKRSAGRPSSLTIGPWERSAARPSGASRGCAARTTSCRGHPEGDIRSGRCHGLQWSPDQDAGPPETRHEHRSGQVRIIPHIPSVIRPCRRRAATIRWSSRSRSPNPEDSLADLHGARSYSKMTELGGRQRVHQDFEGQRVGSAMNSRGEYRRVTPPLPS
jgi:hypothetical protein